VILGEAIKAVVVLADGSSLASEDIIRYCRRHLEDCLVPKQIEFREDLPKTTSGKIRRATLRQGRVDQRVGTVPLRREDQWHLWSGRASGT
jgi:acyl-coenzyme A synthetase/AMP-(fatty) acid ligase